MSHRVCSTQAEADAAAAAGDVIVWRAGLLHARGSATVHAFGSATVSAYGSATVYARDSATVHVFGSATVRASGSATVIAIGAATVIAIGAATVTDGKTNAALRRDRPRIILGPLGSRSDKLGVSLPADGSDPIVYAGCWTGRLSDFAARVDAVYPTGRLGDEYRAAIAMIRAIAAIPQEAT